MHDQSQGGCSDEGDLRPWLWVTLVKQTCVYSPNFTSLDFEASEANKHHRVLLRAKRANVNLILSIEIALIVT